MRPGLRGRCQTPVVGRKASSATSISAMSRKRRPSVAAWASPPRGQRTSGASRLNVSARGQASEPVAAPVANPPHRPQGRRHWPPPPEGSRKRRPGAAVLAAQEGELVAERSLGKQAPECRLARPRRPCAQPGSVGASEKRTVHEHAAGNLAREEQAQREVDRMPMKWPGDLGSPAPEVERSAKRRRGEGPSIALRRHFNRLRVQRRESFDTGRLGSRDSRRSSKSGLATSSIAKAPYRVARAEAQFAPSDSTATASGPTRIRDGTEGW